MTVQNLTRHKTIFLSDIHLGTRSAQVELLLDFLDKNDADEIILVGDIIDFWSLRRRSYWPQAHNNIVQKLLDKMRNGTRIIFVPGNHDEALRAYCGMGFGDIEIHEKYLHKAGNGKKYLVLHGDEFDVVIRNIKWLAFIGDYGYDLALWLNKPINFIRQKLGLGYWSLSSFLKDNVKQVVSFIGNFEEVVVKEAKQKEVDGVICGHIHHANNCFYDDTHYLNCGDWVESCTAIVESDSGEFQIVDWLDVTKRRDVTENEKLIELEAA